jgi:hypothetical protein
MPHSLGHLWCSACARVQLHLEDEDQIDVMIHQQGGQYAAGLLQAMLDS